MRGKEMIISKKERKQIGVLADEDSAERSLSFLLLLPENITRPEFDVYPTKKLMLVWQGKDFIISVCVEEKDKVTFAMRFKNRRSKGFLYQKEILALLNVIEEISSTNVTSSSQRTSHKP